nr:hypothetical protein [Acidobacteriota bacterium]
NQNTPILFFSRRIGLDAGQVVPITVGGRLLGRSGPYNMGALNMQTGDSATHDLRGTNFSVVRFTRDVFARSRIGVLGTGRRAAGGATNAGYTAGADGVFNLFNNVNLTTYYARTETPGRTGDQSSYRGAYAWNADRWGIQADHLHVGNDFNPDVGFLRRRAFNRTFGQLRFSPRSAAASRVRRSVYEASLEYIAGSKGKLETREAQVTYRLELNNGDQWNVETTRAFEGLTTAFNPGGDAVIPIGNYSFSQIRSSYNFGPQRRINGGLTAAYGGFFDGTLAEITWRGRVEPSPTLIVEPTFSWNRVQTPWGEFTTNLAIGRVIWTMSPRRFVSALVQYQSATNSITTNARFRWEYTPGSELFVVYTDGRNTLSRGLRLVDNRSFIVKVTRLFRW